MSSAARKGIGLILLAAIVGLALANLVALRTGAIATRSVAMPSAWQRWRALSASDRLAYVLRYQAVTRHPDAAGAFRQAREFARLSPQRQEYLRDLYRVLEETLDRQSASQRLDLLRSPPRARAFFVYQALEAEQPERLAELAARAQVPP
jgi:hypothetical protein